MIKIRKKLIVFVLFSAFLISFAFLKNPARADSEKSYYYHLIETEITINKDSTFDITEKQTYNLLGSFGYFYRDIELKNLDHISDIEVFDGNGGKLGKDEYTVENKADKVVVRWDFQRRDFNNELKSWKIKYKVYGGLGFFENYDELYWNAVFADRDVIVRQAQILVHLPGEFEKEKIQQRLFVGKTGSNIESSFYQIVDGKTVRFWEYNIPPGSYLTLAVAWPKGAVEKPVINRNQLINWIVLITALIVPSFTFLKTFTLWKKKGKDPDIEKTIIAEYSPPEDLPPAVFGVLMDQSVDIKDILATVTDLAVRGYIKIIEKEEKLGFIRWKEYVFEKLKNDEDLLPFEEKVMKSIFGARKIVSSQDLKNKFYKKISSIKEAIYEEVEKTGYFEGNIDEIRKKYALSSLKIFLPAFLGGGIVLFAMIGLNLTRYIAQFLILEASLVISGIIIVIFSHYMPVLTKKGLEAKWKLLGFKEYLQVAEKFRLDAETLDTFSKFLPYAMVLGVEKKWADRFSEFSYQKQGWYVPAGYASSGRGAGSGPISVSSFTSSFSSFSSSISSTFSSTPGGGAGGVGGGGAGGGGGGGGGGAG